MTLSDSLGAYEVALRVAAAFEKIGVAYFLGGSLASSLQGEPRATNDIDLVIDLPPAKVGAFAAELGADFEVDQEALTEAIARKRSWNIFFMPLVLKIDLFQKGLSAFDDSEFSRRRPFELAPGKTLFVKSPEDSVLRKLLWFNAGGEVSSSQWRDVVEILRVSQNRMDPKYLEAWAHTLGIEPLLTKALAEARR